MPKGRMWSDELYRRAEEFHGHGGPFMVVGLRMGQAALEALDARGWFGIRCKAMLRWRPPDSCVLDGIQVSTGCTTGKHNLEIAELDGIAAEFSAGAKKITIRLRGSVLDEIRGELAGHGTDEAHCDEHDEFIERLKMMPVGSLFVIETRGAVGG